MIGLFVFLVHTLPYGLYEWCFQWILKFVEWNFEYGGAWMDIWFEHKYGKIELSHWWGFHPNALSLSWLCILCFFFRLNSFVVDNHWCAKVMFSNNNKGLWWAWEVFSCSRCDRCFKVGLPTILVEIIMWGDQVLLNLIMLNDFYHHLKKLGSTQTWIPFNINQKTLDLQWFFENNTMIFDA